MNMEEIKFDAQGLIPAIVQDSTTKEVLTLAYMNRISLEKSIETKETWFYSRSRQELWHKGATSGNTQTIVSMKLDCDRDAIVVLVNPAGPACHTGAISCFSEIIF
jgi:phosphoribosyl-ATP pyrophosphohydrolase/phosphoribosyl-AMP cyclohydrolase